MKNFLFLLLFSLLISSCKNDSIRIYYTPKEAPKILGFDENKNSLIWNEPKSWKTQEASGVRKAYYLIEHDVEVTVISFPGDVGGKLANINRWIGQAGLSAILETDLPKFVSELSLPDMTFDWVVIDGNISIRVAMHNHHQETWFFKLMGPKEKVLKHEVSFKEWLKTVRHPE